MAWTIIHRSAEELRGGLRPVESGDMYRPTNRKVGDEPILAGFGHDGEGVPPLDIATPPDRVRRSTRREAAELRSPAVGPR